MSRNASKAINPCPKCKNKDVFPDGWVSQKIEHFVRCRNSSCMFLGPVADDDEKAITEWNKLKARKTATKTRA